MSHPLLLLAALEMFSSVQGKTPTDVWIETTEGWYPRLTKSLIEGKLAKSGDEIGAEFELTARGWVVTVTRKGQAQAKLLLSLSRFADIHPQDVRLITTVDEKLIRLKIPYGAAQEECFANGSDVYASLNVSVGEKAPPLVNETRFEDCQGRIGEPATTEENGFYVIGE